MTQVFQWAADNAGCFHYRMKFVTDAIAAGPNVSDFEIASDTKIPKEWREASGITVVGQRVCLPGPTNLWQKWAAEGDKRLVYEIDDDLFNVDPGNTKAFQTFNKKETKDRIIRNVRVSHTVTVSTEPLAEVIYKQTGHEDIRVIPNAVPDYLVKTQPVHRHTLGYSGSPTHQKDFQAVSRHFRRFLETYPETSYLAIGWDSAGYSKVPSDRYEHIPWIPNPEMSFDALEYSFGIAPLATNIFNRSKSDLKFVENGALGIPTIATSSKPYLTIEHEKTGLLVKRDHEWGRSLRRMYEDKDLREELGRNACDYVRRERVASATRPLWEEVYRGH